MQVSIEGDELVIRMKMLDKPTKSKSGKTLLVATSGGKVVTDALVDGRAVTIGLNAYISK